MSGFDYLRDPTAITRRSFEIIAAEADLSALPADIAGIAARLIHTSGMIDVASDLCWSEDAVAAGRDALAGGAPVICDVRMVAAGIAADHLPDANLILTAVSNYRAPAIAERNGTTRTAAGFEALAGRMGGAVIVIGNAPTALFRVLELATEEQRRPALVLGFPVGFVGAAEAKAALAGNRAGLPFVTLRGRRGGSAMAAAALNALLLETNGILS